MTTFDTYTDDRRRLAIDRLRRRFEFLAHLTAYVLVNAMLVAVWLMTTPQGLFWPLFPIAGWGVGLLLHSLLAFRRPYSEARIDREMRRL